MAEAVAMQGLGWVASPVMKMLIEKAVTYLGTDLGKELEHLETIIIPQFELVIMAAENSPHKQTIIKWLRRLKQAYYETEDIFDELEYERLESEIKNEKKSKGASSSSISKPLGNLYNKVNKNISLFSPAQKKLLKKLNDMKKIAEESKTFCELLRINPENNSTPTTLGFRDPTPSSSFPVNKVIGRDQDRDRIINLLLDEQIRENYNHAIIGIGGAGKTTLVQYIFNDEIIVKYFDVRIWVCLSPKLNVIKHTKEMIESASRKCPQVDSFDALQRELYEILLNSRRTLLVLDDIFFNGQTEEEDWSKFLAPFTSHVEKRHKILVTSRSTTLPNALDPININNLEEMDASNFKSLFRYFAFRGASSSQINELEEVGDRITEKLFKSPLAAKAVASQLRRNFDYRDWRNTLDNTDLSSIEKSLQWTYQRLDAHLQRCFLYCSIFPKGHQFNKVYLVSLWVCEGFIKDLDDANNVMEKAKEYFNELIACSFFQLNETNLLGINSYKIHDLFHDTAEKLSKEDCFRIEGGKPKIPSTVRYISVSVSSLKEHISIISELAQLRTIYFYKPFVDDSNEICKELLSKLKKLRVLVLEFYNNVELSELLGKLKHLRFLDFSRTSICELPESLSRLYHLRVLFYGPLVKKLPKDVCNLKKLQRIQMLGKSIIIGPHLIANVGNLTSLERLGQFEVRKEKGFELHQLGSLNKLRGDLRIENLENSNREDAIEAKLREKKDLESLVLVWSKLDLLRSDFDLEVLEGLQPHENLKNLSLQSYCATRYPSWLVESSITRRLCSLTLESCVYLQVVPPNLTRCNTLVLKELLNLRELSQLPERLTELVVVFCPSLTFASNEVSQSTNQNLSLTKSQFVECWLYILCGKLPPDTRNDITILNVTRMPKSSHYSECLQIFERAAMSGQCLEKNALEAWWHCNQERRNFVYEEQLNGSKFLLPSSLTTLLLAMCNITDGVLSENLRRITSLTELHLETIMTLTTLPSEDVMRELKNLKNLTIINCWCLRSLGFLQGLVSLEKLVVSICPCLDMKHAPGSTTFPTSLRSLLLHLCVIPDCIFSRDMPYLYEFYIHECRGSKSLSIGMLTSLRHLELIGNPDLCRVEGLQFLPCLKELALINLPNFKAESFLTTPLGLGWHILQISSLEMLKVLSASNAFALLKFLVIKDFQEEKFTLEGQACIPPLSQLYFVRCKIKSLPDSLKELSGLKYLSFEECPEISSMPELPESITLIKIQKCPLLKERCRNPNGPDWPKIAHIPTKRFEDV